MFHLPPPDQFKLKHYNIDTQQETLERIQHLDSIRSELGSEIYRAVCHNSDLVKALLKDREEVVQQVRLSRRVSYNRTPGEWDINVRLLTPLSERRREYKSLRRRRVETTIEEVLNVTNASSTTITFLPDQAPYVNAVYHSRGYGNGYASYSVNVSPHWAHTPSERVTKLFNNKFFTLDSKRCRDLDYEDVQAFWVNRAVRKQTVGFKDPEVGYAFINSQGDTSFGETPEKARKALQRAIVKRVRARLLRK